MGNKGKGRQSGGMGFKSQRAVHVHEIREQQAQAVRWTRQETANSYSRADNNNDPRPPQQRRPRRLVRLSQLTGVLRERQFEEAWNLRQRRQRAGFVPQQRSAAVRPEDVKPAADGTSEVHPPGWIVNHGRRPDDDGSDEPDSPPVPPNLQSRCLRVFARYICEYLAAMGRDDLHAAMSLLPGESLTELSVLLSNGGGGGIDDDLAVVLGSHPHVRSLCLRAAPCGDGEDANRVTGTARTLTDRGLSELIPHLTVQEQDEVLDCWEDDDDDDDNDGDDDGRPYGVRARTSTSRSPWAPACTPEVLQTRGCSLRLRRLELLQCQHLSSDVVMRLLEKCSGVTHLSLAGSFVGGADGGGGGVEVVERLPLVLPNLQVLDLTRCPWVTPTLLDGVLGRYWRQRRNGGAPLVPRDGVKEDEEEEDAPWGNDRQHNPPDPLPRIYCSGVLEF